MILVDKALALATRAHATQTRKTDATPYIVHPVAVADLLRENHFDETTQAVALVHDVLEDTMVGEDELRAELGDEVADAVRQLSEDKSLPWEERKQQYIQKVRAGTPIVKAVSLADKIHNAQSLIAAHKAQGPAVWLAFNREKKQKVWFEKEMLAMFKQTFDHPLVGMYEKLTEEMEVLM